MKPRRSRALIQRTLVVVVATIALFSQANTLQHAHSAPQQLTRDDVYALAGECMRLRDAATQQYVGRDFFGYLLLPNAADATPFRMQATDLGSFLLYGPDAHMLASIWGFIWPTAEPGPAADWKVKVEAGALRLTNLGSGQDLAASTLGRLEQDAREARWLFEPASGCAVFPEVHVNIDSVPPQGSSPAATVRGWVDAHVHVSAFEFLGGRVHCGRPWSPYGVAAALKDCPDHAFNGAFAIIENLLSQGTLFATHTQDGWPTFNGWPEYDSITHEGTYWKAIERAWRGGLKIMVSDLVENRALCEIYPLKQNPCTDMESLKLQARDLYKLQDYIDAQFKGPGKGFFRIVKSPDEARAVINQGKLAVVIGVEMSQPFDCLYQRGVEVCTREQIDRGLHELWDLGVRSLFPVHKFDNAFGGAAMDDGIGGLLVNYGNKWMTGRWWEVEVCPTSDIDRQPMGVLPYSGQQLISAFASAEAGGVAASSSLYDNIFGPLFDGPLPSYPAGPLCNVRGLTALGEYLIHRMADMGMIVETDHFSVKARKRALEILEARRYSGLISSHSWGDIGSTRRLQALGGIVAPHVNGGRDGYAIEWQRAKDNRSPHFYWGIGIGTDTNGLSIQAGPRPGALGGPPLTYPFQSFDGRPIDQSRWNTRLWDLNLDGAAHYGLYPDWVEDMRLVIGAEVYEDILRGAEAYLQMWGRAWSSRR